MKLKTKNTKFIKVGSSVALAACLLGGGISGMGNSNAADTDPTPSATETAPTSTATDSGSDANVTRTVSIDTPPKGTTYKSSDEVPLSGTANISDKSNWNVGFMIDVSGSTSAPPKTGDTKSIFYYEQEGVRALYQSIKTTPDLKILNGYFAELGWVSSPQDTKTQDSEINSQFDQDYLGVKRKHDLDVGTHCLTGLVSIGSKMEELKGNNVIYMITDGECGDGVLPTTKIPKIENTIVNVIDTTDASSACKAGEISTRIAETNGGKCIFASDITKLSEILPNAFKSVEKVAVTTTGPNGYTNTQDVTSSMSSVGSNWKGKSLTGLAAGDYKSVVTATYSDGTTKTSETNFIVAAEATPEPTTPEPTTPEPTTPEPTTPEPTTPTPVTTTPAPVTTTPAPVTTTPPAVTETVTQPSVVETTTPAPVVVTPAPVTVTPKPVVVVGPTVQTDYIK